MFTTRYEMSGSPRSYRAAGACLSSSVDETTRAGMQQALRIVGLQRSVDMPLFAQTLSVTQLSETKIKSVLLTFQKVSPRVKFHSIHVAKSVMVKDDSWTSSCVVIHFSSSLSWRWPVLYNLNCTYITDTRIDVGFTLQTDTSTRVLVILLSTNCIGLFSLSALGL